MFEDLKDFDDQPHFVGKFVNDNAFGLIESCLHVAMDVDYITKDDYLYLLSKYKMLYDNWFHGDN